MPRATGDFVRQTWSARSALSVWLVAIETHAKIAKDHINAIRDLDDVHLPESIDLSGVTHGLSGPARRVLRDQLIAEHFAAIEERLNKLHEITCTWPRTSAIELGIPTMPVIDP